MSWTPAANESRVGARLPVMRERRAEMAASVCGAGVSVLSGGGVAGARAGLIVLYICCWDGSNKEVSIEVERSLVVGGSVGASGCVAGGWIGGIVGGRSKAFRDCFSWCSLFLVSEMFVRVYPRIAHLRICSSNSWIFSLFCVFFGFGFFTTTDGGTTSSRENQSESCEFCEKSLSNSS